MTRGAGLSFSPPTWALELMGWAAAAYQYGILARILLDRGVSFDGVPGPGDDAFYYASNTHSVPVPATALWRSTRTLSGISFAVMTVLMSGINMYAMAW